MGDPVPKTIRQWTLGRPLAADEALTEDHFALRHIPMPRIGEGEALVRVLMVNLHANTRRRIVSGTTRVGDTDRSNYACARVVASRDPIFPVGAIVACQAGWQDYQVIRKSDESVGYGAAQPLVAALNGTRSQWTYVFRRPMTEMWSPSQLLNIFGTSGMTAYFGLRECGPLRPGETVAVANAGGAVGVIAAQLARRAGCRVIGFASGRERCRRIVEISGIDACLDYQADDFDVALAAHVPDGIDVFADGVSGGFTARILRHMKPYGRLLAYGSTTDAYASVVNPALERKDLKIREVFVNAEAEAIVAERHIKVESWIVQDFYHERLRAEDDLSRLMLEGALQSVAEVHHGFDDLPRVVSGLYGRSRLGKAQLAFDEGA